MDTFYLLSSAPTNPSSGKMVKSKKTADVCIFTANGCVFFQLEKCVYLFAVLTNKKCCFINLCCFAVCCRLIVHSTCLSLYLINYRNQY